MWGRGPRGITKFRFGMHAMIAMADAGEFMGMWMAHETGDPLRHAFPNGWGDMGEDALGEAY